MIEREARVLARVASEPLSAFFEGYHRERGVEILTGVSVSGIEPGGRGVRLADGRLIAGDSVLVGVGANACEELAAAAGLECRGGVVVDLQARTSDPSVYAVGDCTWRPFPLYEDGGRLESVPNALEQAKQAACAIAGRPAPNPEVPWFWSDQYDLKLQIAGLPLATDDIVVRGEPDTAKRAASGSPRTTSRSQASGRPAIWSFRSYWSDQNQGTSGAGAGRPVRAAAACLACSSALGTLSSRWRRPS